MYISATMNLTELAQRMGAATISEARFMRDAMTSREWRRTEDISTDDWCAMLDAAVDAALDAK